MSDPYAELAAAEQAMLEAPYINGSDDTARRIERFVRARAAVTAKPAEAKPEGVEAVAARVQARADLRALGHTLDAQLAAAPYQSNLADALIEDQVALASALAPPPPSEAFAWGDFRAAAEHVGTAPSAIAEVERVGRAAGWQPHETSGVLAALDELRGRDVSALPDLPALDDVPGHGLARALRGLPESEVDRLRTAGWLKVAAVRDRLVQIGRRMRA